MNYSLVFPPVMTLLLTDGVLGGWIPMKTTLALAAERTATFAGCLRTLELGISIERNAACWSNGRFIVKEGKNLLEHSSSVSIIEGR